MVIRFKAVAVLAACACVVALAALAGCAGQAGSSAGSSAASQPGSQPASQSSAAPEPPASSSASAAAEPAASAGTATIDLDYNAGTGYEWSYEIEPSGVVELSDRRTDSLAAGNVAGGPLQDHFTFRAIAPGETVITFNLVREWEADEPPAETQVYAYTVTDDLQMILNPYKSAFNN